MGERLEKTSYLPFVCCMFSPTRRFSILCVAGDAADYRTIYTVAEGSVLEGHIPAQTHDCITEVNPMRKFLLLASLSVIGLMVSNAAARTRPIPATSQSGAQSQQSTKSVDGTVTAISNKGLSFDLEVNHGGNKEILSFIVDKDTRVEGQVKVGTPVTVDYVAMADQNVARNIKAQA
jgi:hypothetical protein